MSKFTLSEEIKKTPVVPVIKPKIKPEAPVEPKPKKKKEKKD